MFCQGTSTNVDPAPTSQFLKGKEARVSLPRLAVNFFVYFGLTSSGFLDFACLTTQSDYVTCGAFAEAAAFACLDFQQVCINHEG